VASQDQSTSLDWVDPFVGLRLTGKVSDRVFAMLYGDVGGFGVGSELTWQAFAGMGWKWTDTTTLEAGYRYLYIDYEDGGLDMELDLAGFVMGVGFQF
jgi:opacity protein-like surface antigen